MGTKMTLVFSILLGFVLQSAHPSGDVSGEQNIIDNLSKINSFASPQKLYLHLDKPHYQAGETIWFKAYVFDGTTHRLEADTNNVYVELIGSDGKAMDVRIVMAEDGTAAGDFGLRSDFPEGNYVLRAYTDWMRNFGEEYYFTHYFYLNNPGYENMIPRLDVLRNRFFNRRVDRMTRNHEVAFFPEGGNLLQDTPNRVAFKVVDQLGNGQDAEGEIINGRGDVVSTFSAGFNGIGVFEFEPERGETYTARISVDGDRPENYELPDIEVHGYGLRIGKKDDKINVRVYSTPDQHSQVKNDEVIIIGHTRGVPHFAEKFVVADGIVEVNVDKDRFPSGIAHFTLFNGNSVPLAERLIFIDHNDHISFSPRINTVNIAGEEYFDLQLTVRDNNGEPVAGSFSFAAVTGDEKPGAQRNDILSYILLGSDFREIIHNPSVYLDSDDQSDINIDHLLLTYGWRRFEWEDIIAGEMPDIRYTKARGLAIGGRLMDPAKNEPLTNHPVELMIRSGHDDHFVTRTGRGGAFSFPGLVYSGMINIELSSRRLPADYPPEFDLNIKSSRGYDYDHNVFTQQQRIKVRGDEWKRVRGVSASPYRSDLDRNVTRQLYGVPDQTIFIDYETSTERNLYEVLRHRATGMSFEGGRIMIRGPSSLLLSSEPRFMLDGRFVDANLFFGLYPRDIQRIEIFKGPSASIFGVRGGTGVILAYTRRPGYSGFQDVLELAIMGYHSPAEFYADRITDHVDQSYEMKPLKTVHWEPDLVSDTDGEFSVRFPLNGKTDNLRLIIEGAGFNGGLGFAGFTIDLEH